MEQFEQLTAFLDAVPDRYGVPACDCAVARDGAVIYRHSAGFSDPAGRKPVSPRDTYWIYSVTKLFTCTAAMRLAEEGRLELDAPVARYLPEYAHLTWVDDTGVCRPVQKTLRVRNLMSMTGGLDYDLDRPALVRAAADRNASTRTVAAALAEDPLRFEPGAHFLYSLCHDVLGAVIEVAAGARLSEYIREVITEPLGMRDTTFHPTKEQLSRLSAQYAHTDRMGNRERISQDNRFRLTDAYESGGAGLLSTVDDSILLAAALSCGGVGINGCRVLRQESVRCMASDQLTDIQRRDFLNRSPAAKGYSYGLGVRVLVEELGNGVPCGEFGWDGAAGAYVLVDPVNRVAMYYAQQVCQSYITYQFLHPQLRDTLYRCLRRNTSDRSINLHKT